MLKFTNKRVQIKILSILKLVSFESLAGNNFSEWGYASGGNLMIIKCEVHVLDEKYRIAVQGIL